MVITSKAQSERPELTADRQQHVNSKSALFQLRSCSDLRFYRPFRFDFTRELVSRTTLTWYGSQVRSPSCPSLDSADPFELLEIHCRAWHPDIGSELACVHLSIFEHAEIDRRTEQSVRCVGAEAPFNVWSVDAAHLPGELDCRPLFRPLTLEVASSSPFFARPFGSEMGAKENGLRRLFFPSG